jgi:hypothetical protein
MTCRYIAHNIALIAFYDRRLENNGVIYSLDSSHPETEMGMKTEVCDPVGQDSYLLDYDHDYEVSSSSEYTDSYSSTSSMAESMPTSDTAKTSGAADTARIHEEDNSTSQKFQTRPAPRIPLALQNTYIESCRELVVKEPPPRAYHYINQRVSLYVSRPVFGIRFQH